MAARNATNTATALTTIPKARSGRGSACGWKIGPESGLQRDQATAQYVPDHRPPYGICFSAAGGGTGVTASRGLGLGR